MTTLLLCAGDASGDLHGAEFVRAFRGHSPCTRFVGMGGTAMRDAGVELCVDQRALAVGGVFELIRSAPQIAAAWRKMGRALEVAEPDLVVLIDSGGFNLPFARRVRRRSQAPILYYVAPQVWAWRRGRIRKLARRVDRLAVIFPFEPEVYAGSSLRVDFVGHPLVEPLAAFAQTEDRGVARRALGLAGDRTWVALLPGSRRNEIAHQLPIQLEVVRALHSMDPTIGFVLGLAPSLDRRQVESILKRASLPGWVSLEVVFDQTHRVIRAVDVALAKPGTVTLELALLGCPMVVMARAHPLTAAIVRRAVTLSSLSMPNLIAGEPIVPEFLQEEARPEPIAHALAELLGEPARSAQLDRLAGVSRALGGTGAAGRAARVAEEMIGSRRT